MKRLYHDPAARPEHARPRPAAGASPAGRRGRGDGRILPLPRTHSHADWLDERDARLSAPPDRVQLVSENGQTVGSTAASNAERMAAALAPRYGPLTVVPA